MFALILWKKTKEIDVVSLEHIKKTKKGDFVAKWGSCWFPAEIIRKSENKDWLETLDVTRDGKIITPERRPSIPTNLIAEKRKHRQTKKDNDLMKNETVKEHNQKIIQSSSIFEESESSDDSDAGQSTKIQDMKPNESCAGNDFHNSDPAESTGKVHEEKLGCICANLPLVSRGDLEILQNILELARKISCVQQTQQTQDVTTTIDSEIQMNTQMELIKGSRIMVNAWKVRSLIQIHKKNAKEMARKLMKLIVGEDTLKESSPTGKNGWKPIPEDIYEGVEQFVNANIKKKYQISHKVYRETMTAMCATLRNLKPKAADFKDFIIKQRQKNESSENKKLEGEKATYSQQNESTEQLDENVEMEKVERDEKEESLREEEVKESKKGHKKRKSSKRQLDSLEKMPKKKTKH